jgi:hypothetical protein
MIYRQFIVQTSTGSNERFELRFLNLGNSMPSFVLPAAITSATGQT